MDKYENRPSNPRDAASIIIYKKKRINIICLWEEDQLSQSLCPAFMFFLVDQ